MNEYLRRATAAIARFQAALSALDVQRARLDPSMGVVQTRIEKLAEISTRLRAAITRLEHSLEQLAAETALDIVDLQVRMEGEGAALASALKALDEVVEKTPALQARLSSELRGLEESAERVAAAIFPNAIEGVRDINRTLWEFRPLWNNYVQVLGREVARTGSKRLTTDQLARIEHKADQIRLRFEAVNELLNDLLLSSFRADGDVLAIVANARGALQEAIGQAKAKKTAANKPFHGVLESAEKLARKIDEQFADLRVPIFPPAEQLEDLVPIVDGTAYVELAGVERFALLNITARMRSIPLADGTGHLLSPDFKLRVFDVFPDRVYFTADARFIAAVEALRDAGVFSEADASLHKFNAGSFKTRQGGKGNLQISFAFGTPEAPSDRSQVSMDIDIDLYRPGLRHLIGEVLVNHLTGSTTDQFKVFDLLAGRTPAIVPIGGFAVVTPLA